MTEDLMYDIASNTEKRGRKKAVIEAQDKPGGEYVHVQAVTAIPQDILDVQQGEPVKVTFADGYKAWYPEAHALKLKEENPAFVVSIEKGE
jgi:hypothetical protein